MRGAALLAIAAAALFGASAPVAKRLLAEVAPPLLAALLYAGAGLMALPLAARAWRRRLSSAARSTVGSRRREAPLRRSDWPLLLGVIAFGGVAGPLLLMLGLQQSSATVASLLLNLEAVFTTVLAVALFHEWIGRRGIAALVVVVAGCALSTWAAGGATRAWWGPLLIAAACLCWAIDNNLTQRLSLRDPLAVVCVKGLGAAPIAFAIAFAAHSPWPPLRALLGALALGAVAYGASLALYVRATRTLGAARTGVLFAIAPFVGAALAIPVAGEPASLRVAAAAVLIAAGVALLLTERHAHAHAHEPLDHEHVHVHDEHHQHRHRGDEGPEPHSHPHHHETMEHAHPHASDAHHRHKH
jgi:drug/metabolite transporter (DMT)-like permease